MTLTPARNALAAVIALVAMAYGVAGLVLPGWPLTFERADIGGTPITVYHPPSGSPPSPVVVIAHGFAGSQVLMAPFATTLARNGYTAVTFDFRGHGLNPKPLMGSITEERGATRALVEETQTVIAAVRGFGDGRIAILGHSMASDIIVRTAMADPSIEATVAVSMFSPVVTATQPRNLLVIVGNWEDWLKKEALRVVGLGIAPAAAEPGVTYGDPAAGTGRRAAFSPHVEHVGVLYSRASMGEALAWLDAAFGISRGSNPYLDDRGLAVLALLFGIVLLAMPLSRFLPVVASPPIGAGLGWRRLWPVLIVPAIATPLILRVVPTHFLPVLVGDYLAAHFFTYGLLTAAITVLMRARAASPTAGRVSAGAFAAATILATAYGTIVLGAALNAGVTSFVPVAARLPLILAVLVGTLSYFLAVEWATRGTGAGRWAHLAGAILFLGSLAAAVALDFERLFFLVIIIPVILPYMLVYGLISRWIYQRTGHPLVGGIASAAAFALAIGVTFPMLAG